LAPLMSISPWSGLPPRIKYFVKVMTLSFPGRSPRHIYRPVSKKDTQKQTKARMHAHLNYSIGQTEK